ncbi:hypothetical protein ARAM_004080 [Aspergillus rambellii]|uniref:threonine--tRNA ligase n=1 Tax=Aspergillus rambellii TaxID=308745 RepID=A0A0F8UPA0_9EURO|nr:hypothetical protein ARAM_004080 [Aspergillus rambellii]
MRRFSHLIRQALLFRHPVPRYRPSARVQWLSSTPFRSCSCSEPQQQSETRHASSTDYRTLGNSQDLFTTSVYSPGSPLFLPNGTHIINKLISFLRTQYLQYGFREVLTPTIYKRSLWEVSGHWQNYKDDMYEVRGRGATGETDGEAGEDESYGLKPMNCPGHCLLFKSQNHSYRDLPIRYADFSPLHRNEVSGSLSGLTRVRRFHQDDGHIFCRPQQIKGEIKSALGFVDLVMTTFGLGPYRLVLSTRPEKDFIGSLELWNSAEAQLREALDQTGKEWALNEGDGAFYGPKIDIQLQDQAGKYHQLSTIQLDMNLPQRFGLEYQVAEGEEDYNPATPGKATPVLVHRANFGSLERFLALLIEQYGGRWPFWLSPRQGIILTVNQDETLVKKAHEAVEKISGFKALRQDSIGAAGQPPQPLSSVDSTFLIDVDMSSQTLGKKIQRAKQMKYNLIFILGPKDVAESRITVDITGQLQSKPDRTAQQLRQMLATRVSETALQNPRAVSLEVDSVHELLVQLDREAPTLSYTKQLETRVAQLEDALAKLRGPQSSPDAVDRTASSPALTDEGSLDPKLANRKGRDGDHNAHGLSTDFEGLKVEHDGRISFHGPTSLFQLPSGVLNPASSISPLAMQVGERKERLVKNAWRERAIEQMATMPEPFQYLLDSYWCWIQPLFNFLYRPAFTRDMKINGPYYSDALLNAILSHSVRWCKTDPRISPILDSFEGGAVFFHRAVSSMYDSLKESYVGIPTIQTLLLLSAHECGQGHRTQAWLYSGMAFRMLDDLGISIDSRKYCDSAHLSDEDIEVRNRLFWSCYFWDKMVSLYFGRSPTLQSSQGCPPKTILDDTSELELWTPHGVVFPEGTHYPPTQAHSTSCFIGMCGLTEILNEILIHIYNPNRQVSGVEFNSCVREQSHNLAVWWDELPVHLKLIPNDLPPYSPPSHVVILNCVYHTVNILLHRPVLCSKWNREAYDKSHLVQCMTSATAILSVFGMYRHTFGDSHVILSIAYSVYTAASIFLLEIQALKYAAPGTLDKLKFCIFALERVKISNPVMTTALNLIYQEIQRLQVTLRISLSIAQMDQQPHSGRPQPEPQQPPPPPQQHLNQQNPTSQRRSPTNHTPMNLSHITSHQPDQSSSGRGPTSIPIARGIDPPPPPPPRQQQQQQQLPPSSYEITPEVFEAFSYAQPITTNMTTADDYGWAGRP